MTHVEMIEDPQHHLLAEAHHRTPFFALGLVDELVGANMESGSQTLQYVEAWDSPACIRKAFRFSTKTSRSPMASPW